MESTQIWIYFWVILTFGIYIGIALWSRAGSTDDFYVAGHDVHPTLNGMATAADWMSAASFISMAGIIAFAGYDGAVYLMGWTGGYVLLALLLAPYLRKFGKFTVPDFVGDRYYSDIARFVAVICAIFISFVYIAGQMRGVGVVFSRFLGTSVELGVIIGSIVVFFYAVLGGMKGITYTQIAQYVVLIFAYMVPAIFISMAVTGHFVPQLGFIGNAADGTPMLQKLSGLTEELGFNAYLDGTRSTLDVFAITVALMVGTAGLPHVIIRFFTVPSASDARLSAGWALIFIALLYTTAPAVAAFARLNFIDTVHASTYGATDQQIAEGAKATPDWFRTWERTGLLAWVDKNGDGQINYAPGAPFAGAPKYAEGDPRGPAGQRLPTNAPSDNANEVFLDRDIMVLANPEIAKLPPWVIGLVAAGALAAALSTAAGLLLVISSAISHDLCRRILFKSMNDTQELLLARMAAVFAVLVAVYAGINPPGFVAQVVSFAFGLAAASFFPVIMLGIFTKWANREGAIAGMLVGLVFTGFYIVHFSIGFSTPVIVGTAVIGAILFLGFVFASRGAENAGAARMIGFAGLAVSVLAAILALSGVFGPIPKGVQEDWLLGVSPDGIGMIGMLIAFAVSVGVSLITKAPPVHVRDMVEEIRIPSERRHVAHGAPAPAE